MTRILITGACGFIGSSFTRHCLDLGWHVTALDRLDHAGNQARLAPLQARFHDRLEIIWHDLRAEIKPSRLPHKYDYVVHMAAGSHVDRSLRDPLQFVQDNVVGTANLLEWCRHHQPEAKILYFGTDECFGPAADGVSFHEHSRFEPENHYAATKAAAECFCPAYAHQCGMQIVVTHCCNAYGPGQDAEKFIPLCVGKLERGETIQIHARDGKPSSRLYIHVDDVCRATLTVLLKGGIICDDKSGRYNIVADAEYSNLHVAGVLARLLGKPLKYELTSGSPNRVKPDMRYALTDNKVRELGWLPMVQLEDGLRSYLMVEGKLGARASLSDAYKLWRSSRPEGADT